LPFWDFLYLTRFYLMHRVGTQKRFDRWKRSLVRRFSHSKYVHNRNKYSFDFNTLSQMSDWNFCLYLENVVVSTRDSLDETQLTRESHQLFNRFFVETQWVIGNQPYWFRISQLFVPLGFYSRVIVILVEFQSVVRYVQTTRMTLFRAEILSTDSYTCD
jgi:hypothetical protein